MGILIRLLLAAGVLCLGMNLFGAVISYYATLNRLSRDPDASLDTLANRADQVQQGPWSAIGWTVLGIALIATAIGLALFRGRRWKRR